MDSNVFAPALSRDEWNLVPPEIAKKITKFVNEKLDDLLSCRAILETKSSNTEKLYADLKSHHETIKCENEALKARLEAAATSINELESQVSTLSNELIKLRSQSIQMENETVELRHQRNMAVDEAQNHLTMLQRRNTELQRLQLDIDTVTQQLQDAIGAKCEALAKSEEVASLKMTLEYKEKRLDQERELISSQIENLQDELRKTTDDLRNMRRDNSSRCNQLEIELRQKSDELVVANEQIKSLTELNAKMSGRNEELSHRMFTQNETHGKVIESYVAEIEAKTKISNTYKSMHEESTKHAEELKNALSEVQELLQQATQQYGELETKHKESELANEEIKNKKNECINMLKKELETANEIIENLRGNRDLENISASAASISKSMRSGMSYTEIYAKYVAATEQANQKDEEVQRLNNYINCIVREIEERAPQFGQLRQEYSDCLDANDALKSANDELVAELQALRDTTIENRRSEGKAMRENERMKHEIADLSRQVIHLLQEAEHSRMGSSSNSMDNDVSDSVSSADIITKRLVTFNDIAELQSTNQKLLALVRELTERQEEAESFDPAAVADLRAKLEELRETQSELLEEKDKQTKMMATIRNQADMYKNLYNQLLKGEDRIQSQETAPSESSTESDKGQTELENKLRKQKTQIEQLKEEYDTYRKERGDNEKILLEQLEALRNESKELSKLNFKMVATAELNEEKIKVMQNNCEIYKKQITALEKQNRIYSEAIVKHEQAAAYLREEATSSQTRASKADVMYANIEKENALLRDAERRLVKECDMLKQHSHQSIILQTNIELIKATLERNEAENKLRLEQKLDEAHLECSALRRRLEEEQNNFREVTSQLEKQTKLAEQRMEEAVDCSEKLRKEVQEAREDIIRKTTQIDELSKKLKSSVFSIPDATEEGRKLRVCESQLQDTFTEVEILKKSLQTTKESAEEYFNVANNVEKQLKEVLDHESILKQEIDTQKSLIKDLLDKNAELQGELSIQMDDQDIASANIQSKSSQLQAELNVKSLDLQTAREQLELAQADIKGLQEHLKAAENKYAREVTLHSADLQSLTDIKAEYIQVSAEVKKLEAERDQAIEALHQNVRGMEEQQRILDAEKLKLEERFKNIDEQNTLLLDQIQQLNGQLTVLQANTSLDSSMNRSFNEEDATNSNQLIKIIKYLRQEKDIAVSKADIIEAEHFRLKSQFEAVSKQLEEAKIHVEAERQKLEVTNVSASKHSEVLRKLETLSAITDSNRALRQERDQLQLEIAELRSRAEKLEADVVPLQERNRDLATKADQMQTENISLRGECTRWRQRANLLIEKTNRTSPEDWKKLQTERETLAKQLTIERGNNAKLQDDNNNLRGNVARLEEQLKNLRVQLNTQNDEIQRLREQVTNLQNDVNQLNDALQEQNANNQKLTEENRVLTEDIASKDVSVSELRNNLTQVKKIAKKYKTQYEDQLKDIESLRQQNEQNQTEQSQSSEKQNQLLDEQRNQHQELVTQLETNHRESVDRLNQQVTSSQDQIGALKKEIDNLKQSSQEKEEKFKTLFKNAKERIVTLTEQNASLRDEVKERVSERGKSDASEDGAGPSNQSLLEKIEALQRENEELQEKLQQERSEHQSETDNFKQSIGQLERKLGQQPKPSTSSASSEKSSTDRPTADIKPIPGHSTNTQTQSVPIQPWRSGGEPPLASIRPMSQQVRTVVNVLPTTQTPSVSALIILPHQQVHTTGSSSIEGLSSSPTSSHTDYVPATSSASSAMLNPRQVAVPPTQSSEDDDGSVQVQTAPQLQTLAVVSPRVEPPSSGGSGQAGPTQEQGTSSSSSSNTQVTTTQAGLKRQRDPDTDSCQAEEKSQCKQQIKRTRLQQGGISESGLDVEYQVPTSSQRDQDDDNVIVVESDDEDGAADEGEGDEEEPDDADVYDDMMEGLEQDNYEDADCPDDVEDEEEDDEDDDEEAGNEVEVIEDSSEVPNQSESQNIDFDNLEQQQQSEAISSGTDASPGPSSSSTRGGPLTFPRSRGAVPPLPYRQSLGSISGMLDEGALDDGIVPSTPTLHAPRRSDGFGEAVSSPHVPCTSAGRFTFNEPLPQQQPGTSSSVNDTQRGVGDHVMLEVPQVDDNSTGRSVPTTPLQSSPQEAIPNIVEDQSGTAMQADELPQILISGDDEARGVEGSSEEAMGPPAQAGTSSEERVDEEIEGDDGVSSEGEKQPTTDEAGEEEGREAEATPSPNEPRGQLRANTSMMTRRQQIGQQVRSTPGNRGSRMGPTPIVWSDQRPSQLRYPGPAHSERGRGGQMGYGNRGGGATRRPRSRMQRPFGRF